MARVYSVVVVRVCLPVAVCAYSVEAVLAYSVEVVRAYSVEVKGALVIVLFLFFA